MHEARIETTPVGRVPADDGWFILNLSEIAWETVPGGGTWCVFESPSAQSQTLGIGVHVLRPGEAPGFYHAESEQEGFLVLSGECIAWWRERSGACAGGTTCTARPGPSTSRSAPARSRARSSWSARAIATSRSTTRSTRPPHGMAPAWPRRPTLRARRTPTGRRTTPARPPAPYRWRGGQPAHMSSASPQSPLSCPMPSPASPTFSVSCDTPVTFAVSSWAG